MKVKWTEVMKAAHSVGFTDEEHGLIYSENKIDRTIGVEEYSIGFSLLELLVNLGVDVEVDIETPFEK
jgi:hypothetical protein